MTTKHKRKIRLKRRRHSKQTRQKHLKSKLWKNKHKEQWVNPNPPAQTTASSNETLNTAINSAVSNVASQAKAFTGASTNNTATQTQNFVKAIKKYIYNNISIWNKSTSNNRRSKETYRNRPSRNTPCKVVSVADGEVTYAGVQKDLVTV